MCGICGMLDARGDPGARASRVEEMTAALVHRGPDDRGRFDDADVSLGFRRLAVIDLETGQQPIRLEDDAAVIVLNGEIYNYRELRRDLARRHTFRSKGDVEVVLRLYAEEGIGCLRRLNGMFALALWDRRERKLYLARDRFGIKPLFVSREGDRLCFASELGALLAGGVPESPRLDRLELRHYLFQKYTSPHGTILEGVRPLAPATVLEIAPDGERSWRYWDPPGVGEATGPLGDDDAVERLGELIGEAATRQLVADVPVGVFLSGGIDSGTLAAMVRRSTGGAPSTFSIGFGGSKDVANELPQAAAIARFVGTNHHELLLEPRRVADDLPAILGALDGPLGDPTAVPTWYMSKLARETVTVALSGEGADEIFGGYDRQRFDAWMDRLGPLGRRVVPGAMALARGRRPSPRLRERLQMPRGLDRQLDWSRVFTAGEIDALAREPLPDEGRMHALHEDLARRWHERADVDPINARLETDRELFLVGDLLPKVDRMSMAHSLEVRVPYLDNDLADFALTQPGSRKVRGRQVKWMLRRFASSVLPDDAASRPKQGFDVPVAEWLRGPLREVLTDFLSESAVRRRGLFRPEAVSAMVDRHLGGEADHGERLWLLVALEGWMQASLDRRPAEQLS
jgi:asparagine synthase (glutamine-hydrolysing)